VCPGWARLARYLASARVSGLERADAAVARRAKERQEARGARDSFPRLGSARRLRIPPCSWLSVAAGSIECNVD
jgi:hypothetical protein